MVKTPASAKTSVVARKK